MNYPFRFAIGDNVKVHPESSHYPNVAGKVTALELSALGTVAIVRPGDNTKGPFRVMESQLVHNY
jgi:hypothetical protein